MYSLNSIFNEDLISMLKPSFIHVFEALIECLEEDRNELIIVSPFSIKLSRLQTSSINPILSA